MKAFFGLIVIALSGCATQFTWNKPGATKSDYDQAISQCRAEIYRTYPPVAAAPSAAPTAYNTNCTTTGGYTNCNTQAVATNGTLMDQFNRTQGATQLEDARNAAGFNCMRQKGWTQQPKK